MSEEKFTAFTPWSVDQIGDKFVAWRFKGRLREQHQPHNSFAACLAHCDELNRIARKSPEWKAWKAWSSK